ncbi:hypothetical protein E9531_03330 [Lampropedia puyangensis]|uniref:Uncharacterized protein n=1 Tax=Lampropedia puyangensis TaxID=1330072 RepID=A0A4S8FAB1_9BURK|nr:hypothetical protein [Lampropedia puyangensis]THU04440.1 hypothetical protein E9531_03330 [Lampropedia puyangensis]
MAIGRYVQIACLSLFVSGCASYFKAMQGPKDHLGLGQWKHVSTTTLGTYRKFEIGAIDFDRGAAAFTIEGFPLGKYWLAFDGQSQECNELLRKVRIDYSVTVVGRIPSVSRANGYIYWPASQYAMPPRENVFVVNDGSVKAEPRPLYKSLNQDMFELEPDLKYRLQVTTKIDQDVLKNTVVDCRLKAKFFYYIDP